MGADQIAAVARQAGFVGTALVDAIAVALQESGGNPAATNTNTDGSVDRGLWQINNRYHPDVSDACAFDPLCAAQAAYRISSAGGDWSAWLPDFTQHRIDQYLPAAQAAAAQLQTAATAQGGTSAPPAASSGLASWFGNLPSLARYAVLGGAALLVWELV